MVSKVIKEKGKVITIALVMVSIIAVLVGMNYATDNNHYVVDVTNADGESKDNNLYVTEKIVKEAGEQYFDSKELNYELELKNIGQADNIENQIAILTDFSYSMETNDTNNVVRGKALDLANVIITNVKNSRVSISNNNEVKQPMTTNTSEISRTINSLN